MSYWKDNVVSVLICFVMIQIVGSRGSFLKHDWKFNDAVSITKCLLAVMRSDGDAKVKPTVIITYDENTDENFNTDSMDVKIFTQSLAQAYISQIVVKNWQYLNGMIKTYEKHLLIVFIINSYNSLEQLSEKVKHDNKYLIIINNKLKKYCHIDLIAIGQALQHKEAIVIIKKTSGSGYKLLTNIPEIREDTCQYDTKVSLTHVTTCVNGNLKDTELFPSKIPKKLKMCDFKVGMANMYPYAMVKNKNSLRNLQQISISQTRGLDVEIMKIIAKYYNASLKLYYIYKEEGSPNLHQEYVSFLLNGSLDACAGGLYRIYRDLVFYSGVYSRQSIGWVYTVDREPKSWQEAMRVDIGLYIFFLFYLGYSITWIVFCNFDNIRVSYRNTFLYSLGALIGSSSLQESITWKQKILNISYLLLCLHLSAFINVHLYSFLTIQGPPLTLKTNEDVIASGKTLYLINNSKYFIEDVKYKTFVTTAKGCADFQDCEQKMFLRKGLTFMHEAYFHRLQATTAVNDEAKVMRSRENIFVVYHEMIVRKNSPFASKFKLIVQRLFEAGICDRLYVEAVGLLIKEKAKNANANIMEKSYKCEYGCSINMPQIFGAFILWFTGCFLAFTVFLIEIVMD